MNISTPTQPMRTASPNPLVGRLKIFSFAILLLLLAQPAAVRGQYNYTTNDGTITITQYTGTGGDVIIPDMINGLPVTHIGEAAFFGCYSLARVTIGNSVTSIGVEAFELCQYLTNLVIGNNVASIGDGAFVNCVNLREVAIPDGVTTIGQAAFYRCLNLTSVLLGSGLTTIGQGAFQSCAALNNVMIPNSVTSIGDFVFSECGSLVAITVDALNPLFSSVDGVLLNKSQTLLIEFPAGRSGNYTIPNSVVIIGAWAFSVTSVTGVTIPDSVTSIEAGAFYYSSLTSVIITENVTNIGDKVFNFCYHLTTIYFEGNAPDIGSQAFNSEATIYYLPGTTGWGPTFGGRPTVLWNPAALSSDGNFGVRDGKFGFTVGGSSNLTVVVEACADLANPVWSPVETLTLTGGSAYFSDSAWTNHPSRYYRFRSP